jgi:hypothetical protein
MRIFMMALLMLISAQASAEWVKVSETAESWDYFDPASMRKVGSMRRVWQMQDLKERAANGELSRRLLSEYDCRDEKWRVLSFTFHAGPVALGEVLSSHSSEPSRWFDAAPGTVADIILRLVCIR